MNYRTNHVGIFEPNHRGHRLKYVQYLVNASKTQPTRVTVITTQEAVESDHYKLHLEPHSNTFELYLIDPKMAGKPEYFANALATDLMIIPSADEHAWKKLWRRGWPAFGKLHALVMRPSGQSSRLIRKHVTTLIKHILIKLCNRKSNVTVFYLESALFSKSTKPSAIPDPITFDPDPETLKPLLGEELHERNLKWIGALGTLDDRKNVPEILKAIQKIRTSDAIGVVLAGRIDPKVKGEIATLLEPIKDRGIPIVVIDRILTDGELDALIQKCHLVVMAHSNEGPSGIFGKAVEAGTYVVAAGARTLKRDCNQVPQLGAWTTIETDAIASLIEQTLRRDTPKAVTLETEESFCRQLLATK